jgi:predicted O-methyltransferase YrrM
MDLNGLKSTASLWRSTDLPEKGARVRQRYPAGHYYSPIPDLNDVRARRAQLFDRTKKPAEVELREDAQWATLAEMSDALGGFPWDGHGIADGRYRYDNEMFGRGDAAVLAGLLMARRPKRFVEVGSGWSTSVALDVRDRFLDGLQVTCIEPYPERLLRATGTPAQSGIRLLETRLETADPEVFRTLEPGDFLFVDSTHVGKIGSDVNTVLFDILPELPDGVVIHFHDIPWPFEYWEDWVFDGRAWNEAYLLHAFMANNARYRLALWPHMLKTLDGDRYASTLPDAHGDAGGSIYLEKLAP